MIQQSCAERGVDWWGHIQEIRFVQEACSIIGPDWGDQGIIEWYESEVDKTR